jgi:hypothetical protein
LDPIHQCCGHQYDIMQDMLNDSSLSDAIDVVGTHCPGSINGQNPPPEDEVAELLETRTDLLFWNTVSIVYSLVYTHRVPKQPGEYIGSKCSN